MVRLAQQQTTRRTVKTYHLHIKGRVQGVGFRPFVYRLAEGNAMKGWVRNDPDGVHVLFNSVSVSSAQDFIDAVVKHPPGNAIIKSFDAREVETLDLENFQINPSDNSSPVQLMITPDLALCENCRRELKNQSDRRHAYPFITCTQCGPRYSIMTGLPYDRSETTMAKFVMCTDCENEYNDIHDRRHYSQTNSCPACAIKMSLYDSNGQLINTDQDSILKQTSEILNEGSIVAIKGIGG